MRLQNGCLGDSLGAIPVPKSLELPVLAATCFVLASCGGGSPAGPQAPPPPDVTVSFERSRLEVPEGETAEIRIRYQVRSLTAPWQLAISPLGVSASADDFAVSATEIEIPAGQGVSGEASLELAAAPDGLFDEGDETVAIRFVPGGGVNARLGGDIEVVIHDAGVSPCPGASVVATPPEPGGPAMVFVERSFTFGVSEAGQPVAMEFLGPYTPTIGGGGGGLPARNANFAANIAAWEMEADGGTIRHTVRIQIRREAFGDPDLLLAFRGEGCDPHGVACSADRCEQNAAT